MTVLLVLMHFEIVFFLTMVFSVKVIWLIDIFQFEQLFFDLLISNTRCTSTRFAHMY